MTMIFESSEVINMPAIVPMWLTTELHDHRIGCHYPAESQQAEIIARSRPGVETGGHRQLQETASQLIPVQKCGGSNPS